MTATIALDYAKLFDLTGRTALVVGGGSGIGEAACLGLAAHGATCAVADVNAESAERTAVTITASGGRASAYGLDIRDGAAVDATVQNVIGQFGAIDVLLATPAINIRKRFLNYSDEEIDRVLDLNLKGTFKLARAVGRHMVERQRGSIILMSSMRAVNVEPGQSVYAATKAALSQFTRGLAVEFGESGVRVNALAPGIIATPLTAPITSKPEWKAAYAARCALNRWADPSEMAGPIVFLASDASSYVTGTTLFADAGWTAIDGRFKPPV
jgi:NAD(P)-dependent dehydrogenase (short-subunit alcohol dehydrogenase family)